MSDRAAVQTCATFELEGEPRAAGMLQVPTINKQGVTELEQVAKNLLKKTGKTNAP